MKKIIYALLLFFFLTIGVSAEEVTIHLFYSTTCPHCKEEMKFLDSYTKEKDNVNVVKYEVNTDRENSDLLGLVKESLNCTNNYVPYTVIGEVGLTGYSDNIKSQIEHFVEKYSDETHIDIVKEIKEKGTVIDIEEDKQDEQYENVTVPILGEIDSKKVSLPLLAVVIGIVDGFNPCAMWILIFLITMLIGMKDRKRMITLGLTFLVTSALIYMGIMLSWLEILKNLINESYMQYLIGIIAIAAAIWNLYSYYKSRKKETGCEVVNNNKRKKIMTSIKKFTSEKSFLLAILGVIGLAVSVNFIEFACSAGWPIVFTNILKINELSNIENLIYILIYIFFFLIDDIIIFSIAMISFKVTGISNKYSKYSHLIGGILMLIIGLLMLFKPSWLMFNI